MYTSFSYIPCRVSESYCGSTIAVVPFKPDCSEERYNQKCRCLKLCLHDWICLFLPSEPYTVRACSVPWQRIAKLSHSCVTALQCLKDRLTNTSNLNLSVHGQCVTRCLQVLHNVMHLCFALNLRSEDMYFGCLVLNSMQRTSGNGLKFLEDLNSQILSFPDICVRHGIEVLALSGWACPYYSLYSVQITYHERQQMSGLLNVAWVLPCWCSCQQELYSLEICCWIWVLVSCCLFMPTCKYLLYTRTLRLF